QEAAGSSPVAPANFFQLIFDSEIRTVNGRLFGQEMSCSPICPVFNDVPSLWFFWCVAKCVVILFATPLIQVLPDGNRAQRARFPVPGADSASQSLHRGAPSFSSRPRGCGFASELACRSHVAESCVVAHGVVAADSNAHVLRPESTIRTAPQ